MHDDSSVVAARKSSAGHDASFDAIKHVDQHGEWWSARDLMPLMGYTRWQTFEVPLNRAIATARNTGMDLTRNFTRSRKVPAVSGPAGDDYRLTREAAYLVAMNGDPNKTEVATAQAYFAVRAREAEVAEAEHEELPEWAQQQIATIRRVGKLEVEQQLQRDRLLAVESRMDGIQGHYNWFTALGYARRMGLSTSKRYVQNLGRLATSICKRDGVVAQKIQDDRFGSVGSYPIEALEEAAVELAKNNVA